MRSQNDTEIRVPLAKWVQFFGGGKTHMLQGRTKGQRANAC